MWREPILQKDHYKSLFHFHFTNEIHENKKKRPILDLSELFEIYIF